MNTQQIKSFLVAAQCGSFTQAAELLYVTQPALSRQIASLEAELGYKLFARTNRAVRLTFSPSIHDSMVWLQADLGVVMLDSRNMLSASPDIVFLETNRVCNPSVIAIWKKGNSDPAIPLFVELISGTLKQAERNAQAEKDVGSGEDESR